MQTHSCLHIPCQILAQGTQVSILPQSSPPFTHHLPILLPVIASSIPPFHNLLIPHHHTRHNTSSAPPPLESSSPAPPSLGHAPVQLLPLPHSVPVVHLLQVPFPQQNSAHNGRKGTCVPCARNDSIGLAVSRWVLFTVFAKSFRRFVSGELVVDLM